MAIRTKFITPIQNSHTPYLYQVHHTCTIQSHTLSVPSSSHLHNTVTQPICTKFITPAQYSHTPCLYQVHHTCTVQSYTLWSLSSNVMWLQSCVIHLFILTLFTPPPPIHYICIYAHSNEDRQIIIFFNTQSTVFNKISPALSCNLLKFATDQKQVHEL